MSLHLELAAVADRMFAAHLQGPLQTTQDALIVSLDSGVTLTVRYASPDAYSIRWVRDGREAGIDTAPMHPELATFPNHLHDACGRTLPDPLTCPRDRPDENLCRLINALIENPLLATGDGDA